MRDADIPDVPVELVVAAFPDEQGATRALENLRHAKNKRLPDIRDAAVITCDAANTVHLKETADMGGGKGARFGAIVGGAIGLLFPPSVLGAAAVGGAVAGLGAKLHDAGFPDDELKMIGSRLKPGTSALVAVIERIWVDRVEVELTAHGARMVRHAIEGDIARQLEADSGAAYVAVPNQDRPVIDLPADNPGGSPPPVSAS